MVSGIPFALGLRVRRWDEFVYVVFAGPFGFLIPKPIQSMAFGSLRYCASSDPSVHSSADFGDPRALFDDREGFV